MEPIAKDYVIQEITRPEKTYVANRAIKAFDALPAFFSESYREIYTSLEKLGHQPSEPPCAIYFALDEAKEETDLAAAVPVPPKVADSMDFEKIAIPSSKVITTTHIGPYETMKAAYEALEHCMTEHGLKSSLMIEEYFSDPQAEKDASKWRTDIVFVVE